MSEGVFGFLGRSVAEKLCSFIVAKFFGNVGKEEIFAIGHALASEGGFEIGASCGLGEVYEESVAQYMNASQQSSRPWTNSWLHSGADAQPSGLLSQVGHHG